ncbi:MULTISPECIES: metallophosphoesterase [Chryseobacterium]|uniref:metallophosphoesterase family protein n=1 Tax=Chryseobacterium TaxID=59732 RepID=UPI00195E7258|nr:MULTISPECIES: metallophosphoesterase [Chryseobacterium]MBM7421651.1 putative phosphodiesterase [Chryseobacterium sp. JUb44]MDH6211619.1 putative phosphodiesterase [Chryseobacterium sp. BIGb0186]WSO10261.1 metallophosphoesterase [Chryseobacterium scophthalmum]
MRVAVFSDIHGKILLPFKLVDLYQKETGNKIDFILQCGDMGAYPNIENLDKATIKHAQYDRDELGFHDDFIKTDQKIKSFLDDLNINMICVRGNHEDHDFLDNMEKENSQNSLFPIDVYERVFVCRSGLEQKLETENEVLNFVGIGRIGDRKGRTEKRFIQDYERKEITKLLKTKDTFDILITHDKDDSQSGYGMTEIREVLDNVIFHYHFYGHTGEAFKQETDFNGITQSIKVKELEFNESGILEKGCMVILTKENGELSIETVDQKLTNKMTKFNWKLQ